MSDKALSPSSKKAKGITRGLIGKLLDMIAPGLERSAYLATILTEQVDAAIKADGAEIRDAVVQIVEEKVRERIAEVENTFTVIVKRVDYTRSPEEAIRATARTEYLNSEVVETMPRRLQGVATNVEAVFFRAARYFSAEAQEAEFERRGLVQDPYVQAAMNEQDSSFADKHLNGTQWGCKGKVASYLVFGRWLGERSVRCGRDGRGWLGRWWFCGVRKVSPPPAAE